MTAGGAAQRTWHWPARVNLSLPSSACSDWRIWGCILNSLGRWGWKSFLRKSQGKKTARLVIVVIYILLEKKFYIKIFWQTVKSIHKCKYILLLKQ